MKGEFVKIRKITLVIAFEIFPQNDNLGLKLKISKFLGIQPRHRSRPDSSQQNCTSFEVSWNIFRIYGSMFFRKLNCERYRMIR